MRSKLLDKLEKPRTKEQRLMKTFHVLLLVVAAVVPACDYQPTSDDIQRKQQEALLAEGTAQTGMPAIVEFRERKLSKTILELRDQEGLVTYTYIENMTPTVVPGRTVLGGKFTYIGESIGYPLPYGVQYTNPEKYEWRGSNLGYVNLPQAEPNGLYSPPGAEATWVLLKNPGGKEVLPSYFESRITCLPFKYPFD
jgi:hypothetical protein